MEASQYMISRDTIQKRRNGATLRIETLRLSDQAHEHFLCNFLRDMPVSAHMQRKTIDASLTASIQSRERRLVAGRRQAKQVLVTHVGCVHVFIKGRRNGRPHHPARSEEHTSELQSPCN